MAQEFVTKESFGSFHDVFIPPQDHFINVLNNYNSNAETGPGGGVGIALGFPGLQLPNGDVLKQNWLPLAPTKTGSLLEEIINRLADSPTAGGVLTDFFYDFEADATFTRFQLVIANAFGLVDSGVVINPLTIGQVGAESGNTFNLDNLIFKNTIILKGDPNCGSLPHANQVFASQYNHALQRPVWNPGTTYETGDVVQVVVAGFPEQRFFTSLSDSNLGNDPLVSASWDEDFSIDPSNPAFFTPTPWTEARTDQVSNLAGLFNPTAGYDGFMPDRDYFRTSDA